MSRSYRKPLATQGYKGKYRQVAKQSANNKVKVESSLADGGAYKKTYQSWDICDWKFDLPMPKGKSKTARRVRAKSVRK